jgi:hypothetical protein
MGSGRSWSFHGSHGELTGEGEEGEGGGEDGAGAPGRWHGWGVAWGGAPRGSARPGLLVRSPWFRLNVVVREKKGNRKEEEEKRRERKERKKGRKKGKKFQTWKFLKNKR